MSSVVLDKDFFTSRLQLFFAKLGIVSCIMFAFFTEISVSLSLISMGIMAACFIGSGHWKKKICLASTPLFKCLFCFIVWAGLGLIYSQELNHGLEVFFKYSKLIVILFMVYFLVGQSEYRKWVLLAVFAGSLINLILILTNYYCLPVDKAIRFSKEVWPSAKGHFEYGFFMTIFSLGMWLMALNSKLSRLLKILLYFLSILGVFSLLFLNTSKTGYLLILTVILFSLSYRYRVKGFLVGLVVSVTLLGAALNYGGHFKQATQQTIGELKAFSADKKPELSAEYRMYWLTTVYKILKEDPSRLILGYGTGSLAKVSELYQQKNHDLVHQPIDNPHNQFLLLLSENGVVGLFLFLTLLLLLLKSGLSLPTDQAIISAAVVICMCIGCVFNSWLMDLGPMSLFVVYSSLILSKMILSNKGIDSIF